MPRSEAGAPDGVGDVSPPARGGRWWPSRRAAGLSWAALVVVLWNVVFDGVVIQSGREYLAQQAMHQQGTGPAVTIPGVMRPGIVRGFWLATLVAGGVAAVGALLFWLAAWQHRRQADRPR